MSLDFIIQLTSGGGCGTSQRGPHLRYSPAEPPGVRNSGAVDRAWSGMFSTGAGLMRIVRRPSKNSGEGAKPVRGSAEPAPSRKVTP
jgi:hypothetical protein